MNTRKGTIEAALERTKNGTRLTVAQGAILAGELEVEQMHCQRLIVDWNATCHVLDRILHIRLWGDEKGEWTVVDRGTEQEIVTAGSIPQAYEAALHWRMDSPAWRERTISKRDEWRKVHEQA